ncbi:MAG TPA: AAA family ATPase [Bacteroidales bacterium]|nr:AAA family ATPase [Bacteroidales bacterium]
MLNIKRLLLGNFRIFTDVSEIRLAPLTILTGPNNTGKSTIPFSISLMKNLNTGILPFRLRFDNNNPAWGFDMIAGRKSKTGNLKIGYDLYNILLGENVKVEFNLVKGDSFDAVVRSMKISNANGTIFDFEFAENRIAAGIGAAYLYDKLKEIAGRKSQFAELERNFRKIHSSSGHYKENKSKIQGDSGVGIFHIDGDTKRRNLDEYLKEKTLSPDEYERLSYFYGSHRELGDCKEKQFITRGRKIIDEYESGEILFNSDLLKKIVEIPVNELDEQLLISMIRKNFPDLFDCLLLLNDQESVSPIVSQLKSKSYTEWEKEYLECNITTTKQHKGQDPAKELSLSIEHHLQARFELSGFFRAVASLSMTREGFSQAYGRFANVRALSAFAALVMEKILHDLKEDIDKSVVLNRYEDLKGPNVDFTHPLHEMLRKYSTIKRKDTFLKKWVAKFRICDDIILETPVKGLGYFPSFVKNKENSPMAGESGDTGRLLMILLNLCNSKQSCELRDYSNELKNYPVTVMMEKPENGFHPSWQSKLADLFADARRVLGLHFIIETHSEYFINKIQYLVATGKLDSSDVVIYYFDGRRGSVMNEITLDQKGNLSREIPSAYIDEEDRRAMGMFKLKRISRN